tara:strand:- start:8483 stop:8731 length:249 start_codon:yes stop_codon:yes gene_type:complete
MSSRFENPEQKMLLAQMAFEADEQGLCYAVIEKLGPACGLSLTKTFKIIEELKESGCLDFQHHANKVVFKLNPARISEKGAH